MDRQQKKASAIRQIGRALGRDGLAKAKGLAREVADGFMLNRNNPVEYARRIFGGSLPNAASPKPRTWIESLGDLTKLLREHDVSSMRHYDALLQNPQPLRRALGLAKDEGLNLGLDLTETLGFPGISTVNPWVRSGGRLRPRNARVAVATPKSVEKLLYPHEKRTLENFVNERASAFQNHSLAEMDRIQAAWARNPNNWLDPAFGRGDHITGQDVASIGERFMRRYGGTIPRRARGYVGPNRWREAIPDFVENADNHVKHKVSLNDIRKPGSGLVLNLPVDARTGRYAFPNPRTIRHEGGHIDHFERNLGKRYIGDRPLVPHSANLGDDVDGAMSARTRGIPVENDAAFLMRTPRLSNDLSREYIANQLAFGNPNRWPMLARHGYNSYLGSYARQIPMEHRVGFVNALMPGTPTPKLPM